MSKHVGFQVDHRNYLIKEEKEIEDQAKLYTLEFGTNTFFLYIKDSKFELLDASKNILSTGLSANIKLLGFKDESYQ